MSNRIEGDLNVGRNIYAGGNLNIPGKATIGHNLIVKGWLEAENIKDANKGLFSSLKALKEAYPYPEHGWWALVGETFPADVYRAEESEGVIQWVATDGDKCPLGIDLTNYINQSQLEGALEAYATKENAEKIEGDISKIEQEISGYANSIDLIGAQATNALNTAESLRGIVDGLSLDMETKSALIDENTESIVKHRSDVVNDVARLDVKNAEQDSEINSLKQSVQGVSNSNRDLDNEFHSFKDEVETKQYQVDNKITNVETLNAKQTLWHEAHSIINLHRFVNFATVESSIFPEYMTQVPSQLIRNGLIVMINTAKGWEAWQLVNADMYLEVTGYKKLDWDNSLVLTEINALKARIDNEVANLELEDSMINDKIEEANVSIVAEIDLRKAKDAEQDTRISQLEENGEQQKTFNIGVETHIMQTENDYIGVKDADGNGTLFPRVIALEGRVDSVDLFIREIELRLDALNSRISELEGKM